MSQPAEMKKGTSVPHFAEEFVASVPIRRRPGQGGPFRRRQAHRPDFLRCPDSGRRRQPRKCRFFGTTGAMPRIPLTISPFWLSLLPSRFFHLAFELIPFPCFAAGGPPLNRQCGRIGREIVPLDDSTIPLRFPCSRKEDIGRGKPLVNGQKGEW